ncbi:GTPase [Nonlabens agnitus]|uniref:GTPase n=1 Tax=Nonlabens agnitus TaxID=870484 RepID=A0A2S9WWB8_9FLAO|nr:GTPase [Nonlabens agnitus]PRP67666.1 GTPase [Nonlabens agnitus]
MRIDKLIFVYNANSGTINAWLDSAHKVVSPSTYQCKLCELTYGVLKEIVEWARFRESELIQNHVQELEFLHRDEFNKNYNSKWLPKYEYPLILMASSQGLEVFMSAQEMHEIETTTDLISAIESKLKAL